jgi:diamine N-acetyltransferase
MNVNWNELKQKTAEANLKPALAAAMTGFLDTFAALPDKPYTVNPHYFSMILSMLVRDVCAEGEVEVLWWEMILDLARKWASDRGSAGEPALKAIAALTPPLAEHFPNDDTHVTLEEIDMNTVHGIMLLSETLSEPKRYFVATNAISLAQANFTDRAWFRAIYAGRTPIGFVMLSVDEEKSEYFVWRFMLGEPFHGRGYGRKAMDAIMAHVRTLPNAKELQLSYGQGPGSPEGFYKKIGFVPTGKAEHGEVYARIEL